MIIKGLNFEVLLDKLPSSKLQFASENERLNVELIKNWLNGEAFFEFQTSGSTGKPKKIIVPREHLKASAKRTLDFFQIKEGSIINCLSVSHVGGAMQVIRALVGNLDLVILEPSIHPFADRTIAWEKVSLISFVPYQLKELINQYSKELSQCKTILLGGASPDSDLVNTCKENKLINIFETYGMTETLSHVAVKNITNDSEFKALNGVTFSKDENNCLVIHDTFLEIKELKTNDIVKSDSQNSFEYLGRIDNVINSGGLKFYPETIEKKLSTIFKNKLLIFPLPHPTLGQCLNLLIEGEIDTLSILEKIKQTKILSQYELPKSIHYLDSFVYTANQKIKRVETLELLTSKYI